MEPRAGGELRRGIFDRGDAGEPVDQQPSRLPRGALTLLSRAVEDNPLFESLSPEERRHLLGTMSPIRVPVRTVLITQGDVKADTFYVVETGRCRAFVDGIAVKEYEAGGSFGELSLLFSKPRAATVSCQSDCALYVLRRSVYDGVRAQSRLGAENRFALLIQRVPELAPLSEATRLELHRGLKEVSYKRGDALPPPERGICWMLSGCAEAAGERFVPPQHYGGLTASPSAGPGEKTVALTDCECVILTRSTVEKLLGPPGELLIFDSLRALPMLFPLRPGQLFDLARVLRAQPERTVTKGSRMSCALLLLVHGHLEHGGESVQRGACVAGKVRAEGACKVKVLDDILLEKATHLRAVSAEWRLRVLRGLPELAHLDPGQMFAVRDSLRECRVPAGTEIVAAGEEVPGCFIVQSGLCRMGNVDLGPGTHFGGWAMLGRKAEDAVVAATDVVLLPVEPADRSYSIPRLEELQSVKELGAGSYGQVMMVRCSTGRAFALKRLDKVQVKQANMVAHVKREKVLHSQCASVFVTQMWGSYNRGRYLYMLMECVQGGDLYTHMSKVGAMSEGDARFYAACVVCGLDHLHSRRIAWRDLKPENLLVDEQGYLKLTDLGFACTMQRGQRSRTLCGTAEFMAPELVLKQGHTMAVDWWALGVLVFEMVAGRSPFSDGTNDPGGDMRTFRNICRVSYSCPATFSPPLVDLLYRLLEYDPARRLCSGIAGAVEVREHAWFSGFDWAGLQARSMSPTPPTGHHAQGLRGGEALGRLGRAGVPLSGHLHRLLTPVRCRFRPGTRPTCMSMCSVTAGGGGGDGEALQAHAVRIVTRYLGLSRELDELKASMASKRKERDVLEPVVKQALSDLDTDALDIADEGGVDITHTRRKAVARVEDYIRALHSLDPGMAGKVKEIVESKRETNEKEVLRVMKPKARY